MCEREESWTRGVSQKVTRERNTGHKLICLTRRSQRFEKKEIEWNTTDVSEILTRTTATTTAAWRGEAAAAAANCERLSGPVAYQSACDGAAGGRGREGKGFGLG
jgi:hypothetical protein